MIPAIVHSMITAKDKKRVREVVFVLNGFINLPYDVIHLDLFWDHMRSAEQLASLYQSSHV